MVTAHYDLTKQDSLDPALTGTLSKSFASTIQLRSLPQFCQTQLKWEALFCVANVHQNVLSCPSGLQAVLRAVDSVHCESLLLVLTRTLSAGTALGGEQTHHLAFCAYLRLFCGPLRACAENARNADMTCCSPVQGGPSYWHSRLLLQYHSDCHHKPGASSRC